MRIFVDSINEGMAKILLGDEEEISVIVPVCWLPDGVKEGDVVRADFTIDSDATAEGKARVQDLFDKLGNNP